MARNVQTADSPQMVFPKSSQKLRGAPSQPKVMNKQARHPASQECSNSRSSRETWTLAIFGCGRRCPLQVLLRCLWPLRTPLTPGTADKSAEQQLQLRRVLFGFRRVGGLGGIMQWLAAPNFHWTPNAKPRFTLQKDQSVQSRGFTLQSCSPHIPLFHHGCSSVRRLVSRISRKAKTKLPKDFSCHRDQLACGLTPTSACEEMRTAQRALRDFHPWLACDCSN